MGEPQLDLFIAGFSCKQNSLQNGLRWQEDPLFLSLPWLRKRAFYARLGQYDPFRLALEYMHYFIHNVIFYIVYGI